MAKATPITGVGPRTRIGDAAERVVGLRLADVRQYEESLSKKIGVDDVHDMRVATRRLRAALQLVGAPKQVEVDVKRFQDALGAVRDIHVQREWIEKTAKRAAKKELPLERTRHSFDRDLPQKEVALRQELKRWQTRTMLLVRASIHHVSEPHRFGGSHVRTLVKKRLRAIEKGLTCFVDTTDARTAHRLRIQAKKLRYLAELLEPVWPDKIPALLQALVPLQETFGELHDADVRIAEFIARAGLEKHADPHAIAWLNQVEDERAMLAEKGLALAHRWRSESLGRDLRRLFRKPAPVSV